MKCVILAAGYATRLYPLTENFPKPLLKVKEKSILDWLIEDLELTKKIDEYIIISNHKFINHFYDWKNNNKYSSKITVLDDGTTSNDNRLGAVCDIEYAIDGLNLDDDLLVIAGDNLLDFSLNKFIEFFEQKKKSAIMYYEVNDIARLKKSANIAIDSDNKVINMIEKPENPISNLCCPAFYIYAKEDVPLVKEALDAGCKKDAPGSFICWLYQHSDVYAMKMPGNRYDIGDINSYHDVNENYEGIDYNI